MSSQVNIDTGVIIGHQMGRTEGFSMVVEDVFEIPGFGIAAAGRVLSGSLDLYASDTVMICNFGREIESHVLNIEMFRKLFSYCEWGDHVGLLLPKDDEYYVHSGSLICSSDFPETTRGKFEYYAHKEGDRHFADVPYHERQFIFMVKNKDKVGSAYDTTGNINFIFPYDNYPKDIAFPFGHPQPNTLYYAHPLRPYYMPVEDAGVSLFYERIQEMSRLMQCLGAEIVSIRCVKGNSISEGYRKAREISASGGYLQYHADGSYRSDSELQSYQEKEDEMSDVRHFHPTTAPYCPDDLLWATVDPDLNALVKQRLDGGLLTFSKRVSTKETMNLSISRLKEIGAAFNAMIASVSGNYSSESIASLCESTDTLWEISAEFKPMNEFKLTSGNNTTIAGICDSLAKAIPSLTGAEQEYLEEYRECLKNGEISSSERRLLNKLARRLGLTDSRIAVLEKNETPLTDEEKEYLEEYRLCLEEDGEISSSSRRLLNRLANSLGITSERISQLEKS